MSDSEGSAFSDAESEHSLQLDSEGEDGDAGNKSSDTGTPTSGVKRKGVMDDEDDDDDDDDYDEEEDEDELEGRHRKKRKPRHGGFILDEADVDDDAEDEDEEAWEEGAQDIIDNKTSFRGPDAKDIEGKRRLGQIWNSEREEEIEDYYRRKYADYGAMTPNPATPGYQADTPSPMGPFTPQTPGSAYSPYQASPSPAGYQASPSPSGFAGTPSPAGYQPTPSPGGYAGTPSPSGYSPQTPGNPFTPQTPGSAMEANTTDWHTTEIEVKIKETHEDANLILQTGVIRSVSGGMCSVFIPDLGKVVNVASVHLQPVPPEKGDRAKVILGQEERESTGSLLSIDGTEGVMKLDSVMGLNDDIKMLPIHFLCKMPNN